MLALSGLAPDRKTTIATASNMPLQCPTGSRGALGLPASETGSLGHQPIRNEQRRERPYVANPSACPDATERGRSGSERAR